MWRFILALVCALFVIAFPYAQQPPFGQTAIPPPPVELRPFSLVGGGKVNGPILFPDGTVGAPSISFSTSTNDGFFLLNTDPTASAGGIVAMHWTAAPSADMRSDGLLRWSSTGTVTDTKDLVLRRVSANRLSVGNGSTLGRIDATSLSGASIFTRTAVLSADYTVLPSDMVVAVTSLNPAAQITITLPSPTTADLGKVYIVSDESGLLTAGTNSIFISGTIKQVVGTQAMVGVYATSRYIAGGPTGSRSWFSW